MVSLYLLLICTKIWNIYRKWQWRGLATCEDINDTSKYMSNRPNSIAYLRIFNHSWFNLVPLSSNSGVASNSEEYFLLKGVFDVVRSSNSLFEITSFTVFSAALIFFWECWVHIGNPFIFLNYIWLPRKVSGGV